MLTVQQLVWSVTSSGVVDSVRFLVQGKPIKTLFGHVDVSKPVRRAAATEVLHPATVLTPGKAETYKIKGGTAVVPVTFGGFQPGQAVSYHVTNRGTSLGGSIATLGPGRFGWAEAAIALRLPPGAYTISVTNGSYEDSRTVFVELSA
jgi:hypothetical protein